MISRRTIVEVYDDDVVVASYSRRFDYEGDPCAPGAQPVGDTIDAFVLDSETGVYDVASDVSAPDDRRAAWERLVQQRYGIGDPSAGRSPHPGL